MVPIPPYRLDVLAATALGHYPNRMDLRENMGILLWPQGVDNQRELYSEPICAYPKWL